MIGVTTYTDVSRVRCYSIAHLLTQPSNRQPGRPVSVLRIYQHKARTQLPLRRRR